MDIIFELIYKIKDNPDHYIKENTLKSLNAFITGYIICQAEFDSGYAYRYPIGEFNSFIHKYYKSTATAAGWEYIISNKVKNSEKAFKIFFDLFDKYLLEKGLKPSIINIEELNHLQPIIGAIDILSIESIDIIYRIIFKIRRYPGMYISDNSIKCLYHLIAGYICRIRELDSNFESSFFDFDKFVQNYYDISFDDNWGQILYNNYGEEKIGVFFELIDQYLKEIGDNTDYADYHQY